VQAYGFCGGGGAKCEAEDAVAGCEGCDGGAGGGDDAGEVVANDEGESILGLAFFYTVLASRS
jgi:hypothetical protein